MTNHAHECPACKGHGWIELTGVYLETLKIILKAKTTQVVANRDHWFFGCSPTALNNRLARLEQMGYLKSERCGRQRRFYAK